MPTAVIAEFDPFHNGHKYLIDTIKKNTDDAMIAVMSGAWVQRGGPAITDKFTRTRMALSGGIDLVLELPVIYSMSTAERFAAGAVAILKATGITNRLAFGSECGDAAALTHAARALLNEPPEVSEKIKKLVSAGDTYAAARDIAYAGIIPRGLLSSPNDILATEYITAATAQDAGFLFIPIKRRGAAHDGAAADGIASASEIRKMLRSGNSCDAYMPRCDFPIYDRAALDTAVISRLRMITAAELRNISDVSEGLENRFIAAAKESTTVDELCRRVKSKRYTMSRIRRIAYAAFLGITKEYDDMPPSYIRVLGMTERGRELLRQMKTAATLPVVIKPADRRGDAIFDLNSRAEDVFALAAPTPELRRGGRDLTTSPVVV